MIPTGKAKLASTSLAMAAAAMLSINAVAYACTLFTGTFSVTGNNALTGTVTATGTGMMTQSVSAGIARSNHSGIGSTTAFTVSTGLDGSGSGLKNGTFDINFYNSGSGGSNPGYTDHSTWNTDCMTSSSGQQGTKLGTVTTNGSGLITSGTNVPGIGGQYNGNNTYTYNSGIVAPNTDVSPQESAVCISDSSGSNGNEAPLTIV